MYPFKTFFLQNISLKYWNFSKYFSLRTKVFFLLKIIHFYCTVPSMTNAAPRMERGVGTTEKMIASTKYAKTISSDLHNTIISFNQSINSHLYTFISFNQSINSHLYTFISFNQSIYPHLNTFISFNQSIYPHLNTFISFNQSILILIYLHIIQSINQS